MFVKLGVKKSFLQYLLCPAEGQGGGLKLCSYSLQTFVLIACSDGSCFPLGITYRWGRTQTRFLPIKPAQKVQETVFLKRCLVWVKRKLANYLDSHFPLPFRPLQSTFEKLLFTISPSEVIEGFKLFFLQNLNCQFGINVQLCDVLPFIDGLVLVQECFACQARQYWSSLTLSVIQVWF